MKDENLRIFGFSSSPKVYDRPAKRKRTKDPDSNCNGLQMANGSNTQDTIADFQTQGQLPGFRTSPSALLAEAWRQAVLTDMYPGPSRPRATRRPTPAWDPRPLPPLLDYPSDQALSISYLLLGNPIRGKFLPHLAKAQGVPAGPLFGKLTKGETVITPTGQVVKPSSCMEAGLPAPACLVIDCPNLEYFESLKSQTFIGKLSEEKAQLKAVYFILGPRVIDYDEFWSWARNFGSDCQVIMANISKHSILTHGSVPALPSLCRTLPRSNRCRSSGTSLPSTFAPVT